MDSEYVRAEKHCFSLFGFITLKFERNWHGIQKGNRCKCDDDYFLLSG